MRSKFTVRAVLLLAIFMLTGLALAQRATPPPPPGGGQGGQPPQGGGGGGQQSSPEFDLNYVAVASTYTGIGTISIGEGTLVDDLSLTQNCTSGERFVAGASGVVVAEDGSEWSVPMEVHEGAGAVDIFNDCTGTGDNADYASELEPVVIDEAGVDVTGAIFADNYFELYVNGEYVSRDTIGFVPFNSSAVSFKAAYPMTLAVRLADWEDHFGLGMEYDTYHVGDAGFIANFSNGVVTNDEWKCQPVYIAPLDDPACVVEDEFGNPDSSACSIAPVCSTENANQCRALHYELPEEWAQSDFDDANWLPATLYEADRVTNQAAYQSYTALFSDAQFIWSQNLNLDNQVVCRITIAAAP